MSILQLHPHALHQIFDNLDPISASSFALTCRQLSRLHSRMSTSTLPPRHIDLPRPITGQGFTAPAVHFRSPFSPSPSSHHADNESLASTDTEALSSPGEDDWQFEVTPEIIRRLSELPDHKPGHTLPSLPTEIHLEIFSYLDKIDSCCLGLSSPNLYVVYRAIHGTKMPLNTRRKGPNSLESAWEVVGKQECKHCGVYRCELHQHIRSWMPQNLEYCAMKQNFGRAAIPGAKETCYRGKPSKPKRCGRHPMRTTSIHQDDPSFNLPA